MYSNIKIIRNIIAEHITSYLQQRHIYYVYYYYLVSALQWQGDIWEPPAKRRGITSPPPVAAVCNKHRRPDERVRGRNVV